MDEPMRDWPENAKRAIWDLRTEVDDARRDAEISKLALKEAEQRVFNVGIACVIVAAIVGYWIGHRPVGGLETKLTESRLALESANQQASGSASDVATTVDAGRISAIKALARAEGQARRDAERFTAEAYAAGATGECEDILGDVDSRCEDLRVFFNDLFIHSFNGVGYIPEGFGDDLVRMSQRFRDARRILCAHKLWPSVFENDDDSPIVATCEDYGAMVGMELAGVS